MNSLVDPAQGGILRGVKDPGRLENAYYEMVTPDGRKLLILSLEWGPRQQTVAWANQIVGQAKFADHTVLMITHAYMYHDDTRYDWSRNLDADPINDQGGNPKSYPTSADTSDGEDLWNALVSRHGNFEFVLSGHVGGDGLGYLASTADEGNLVHQMLFNSQFEGRGGNGWIRILEFLQDRRTVRVRTYSPLYGLERTDSANTMLLEISPVNLLSADFNFDRDVDGADYEIWQSEFAAGTLADADRDGDSDATDFLHWQRQFGLQPDAVRAVGAVPEPNSWWPLALLFLTPHIDTRRRNHYNRRAGRISISKYKIPGEPEISRKAPRSFRGAFIYAPRTNSATQPAGPSGPASSVKPRSPKRSNRGPFANLFMDSSRRGNTL
jgi:hypothetical protein